MEDIKFFWKNLKTRWKVAIVVGVVIIGMLIWNA